MSYMSKEVFPTLKIRTCICSSPHSDSEDESCQGEGEKVQRISQLPCQGREEPSVRYCLQRAQNIVGGVLIDVHGICTTLHSNRATLRVTSSHPLSLISGPSRLLGKVTATEPSGHAQTAAGNAF